MIPDQKQEQGMTPEEAISVNTRLAKELDVPQRAKEREAVNLGIEALKKLVPLSPSGAGTEGGQ